MTEAAELEPIRVLADPEASVAKISGALNTLDGLSLDLPVQKWGVLSNITLNMLDIFLRKHGYLSNVKIELNPGTYNNYLEDLRNFKEADISNIIFVPFFDNIQPSLEDQIPNFQHDQIEAIANQFFDQLSLILNEVKAFATLWITDFHRYSTRPAAGNFDLVDDVIYSYNQRLRELCSDHANVRILSGASIIENLGAQQTFDERFYYQSKAPYSGAAQNLLAHYLRNASRNFGTEFYKVLVLDCDGTLWGGIVGEDTINGIKLDPHDYPGNVYWRVQQMILGMAANGAIICLCSKNEENDVNEVIENHPFMALTADVITAKKVNWRDKAENLTELAKDLNVGLDSFVFVDDSAFECAEVSGRLPEVTCFNVPKKISDYPRLMSRVSKLFSGTGKSSGKTKIEHYKIRAQAEDTRSKFSSHEEFLKSLEMKIYINKNTASEANRISELSQKTNQFNLTTIRYSEAEIEEAMNSDDRQVYSLSLKDKFGSHGLTGVAILAVAETETTVQSLFLSCRILGRDIEIGFWNSILSDIKKSGCKTVKASYIATPKNAQVRDFYDRLGFNKVDELDNQEISYECETQKLHIQEKPWLEIING